MSQSLSFIHPDAKIAENVVIETFSTIYGDVEIGEGTRIGPNATIMDGARIGKNCTIFPGAVISGIPQDLKFNGEQSTAVIGDNTTIRECVTINRGTKSRGTTVVGSNCLLMAYVHVAHDCIIGDNVILVNSVGVSGEVEIDDWAIIGGISAIHQFVRVGKHAMIAGGSLVRKDVPPYVKVAREPLSYVGVNSIGLRRRNFTNDQINMIQNIYRIVYQENNNTNQALQKIGNSIPDSFERNEIISFIKNSSRGISKGYSPTIHNEQTAAAS